MDYQEWFTGADNWYNLASQLCVGYMISFSFFVMQVYLPNKERELKTERLISDYVSCIIVDMTKLLTELDDVYNENSSHPDINNLDFKSILKFNANDKRSGNKKNCPSNTFVSDLTVGSITIKFVNDTNNDIGQLMQYYSTYISVELLQVLREISKSYIHTNLINLINSKCTIDFSNEKENYFVTYFNLLVELKELQITQYPRIPNN